MRISALLLPIPLAFGFLAAAHAASSTVVISQIYGAGGNNGALYTNDYVELFNRSTSATADLTGWSLQYASSSGTSTWLVTNLSGSIAPGKYFLVQLAGGSNGVPLPVSPDFTGTTNISSSSGKLAVVNTTTELSGPVSGVVTGSGNIVDLVGYGSANYSETAPAPGLGSAVSADFRNSGGCSDTDNNAVDFINTAISVAPRNSASSQNLCLATITSVTPSAAPAGTAVVITIAGTGFLNATVKLNATVIPSTTVSPTQITATVPATLAAGTYTLTVVNGDGSAPQTVFVLYAAVPISQIQGSGDTSPLAGQVVQTTGIVTGLKSNGFFLQTPDGQTDNNPATSEGIFVFTSSAPPPTAAVGNFLLVTGTVQEFAPSSDPFSPTQTEIGSATLSVLSTNNPLPAAIPLTTSDLHPGAPFDNLEKYEGMRVRADSLTVSGPTISNLTESTETATSTGVFFGVLTGTPRPFREPGVEVPDPLPPGAPANVPRFDANAEHIRVDTGAPGGVKIDVTAGAVVTNLIGPLDYGFRNYSILQDPGVTPGVSGNVTATPVPAPTADEFTIASFNLQRFYDTADDPNTQDVVITQAALDRRIAKASLAIRNTIRTPDVLGVEEMENLSTLQLLASQISTDATAAGQTDPHYQAFLVPGNDVGGINVGLLISPSKITIGSVTQYGKETTYIDPSTGQPAILNDRPPLLLDAQVGRPGSDIKLPLKVVVNHLRSLSGINDPTDGARVRAKREAQAEYLAGLLQSNQASGYLASVGDYNAYQFNDGYVDVIGAVKGTPVPADQVVVASPPGLVNPPLTDLTDTLVAAQQYSYTFDGDAEVLDHVLVNTTLFAKLSRAAYGRNNADFPGIYLNDATRPERVSDHDPDVAYFRLPPPEITTSFSVSASGPVYNRSTKLYTSTITITNKGASSLTGPFPVLLTNLTSGVTVANPAGMIVGAPYVLVFAASLAPNQKASVTVQFSNPSNAVINFTPRVFSGAF